MTERGRSGLAWFIVSAVVGLGGFAYEGLTAYYWGMGWTRITFCGVAEFFVGALVVTVALGYFVKHQPEWIGL